MKGLVMNFHHILHKTILPRDRRGPNEYQVAQVETFSYHEHKTRMSHST